MTRARTEQARKRAVFWLRFAAVKIGVSMAGGVGLLLVPIDTWPAFGWGLKVAINIALVLLSLAVLFAGWLAALSAGRSYGLDDEWYRLFFPVIFGPGAPLVAFIGGLEYVQGKWAHTPDEEKYTRPYGWAFLVLALWTVYVMTFALVAAAVA